MCALKKEEEVGVWGFPFCACHRAHLVWAPPCSLFPGQCTYPGLCVLNSVVATQLLVFWKDQVQQILNYHTSLSWKAYNVFFPLNVLCMTCLPQNVGGKCGERLHGDCGGISTPKGTRIRVWIPLSSAAMVALLMTGYKSHLLGR